MLDFTEVVGNDIGDIKIYTLSTCGWCKKTKAFFNSHSIRYSFIDVDRLLPEAQAVAKREQLKFNPRGSYPTIVINDSECIIGFDPEQLQRLVEE